MVSDTQRFSNLLSPEENKEVVSLLGERCQPLVMSIVQVFQTGAPEHSSWRKRDAGVLVLVKDNARRSYFFRLYCLTRRQLVWEHEVYSNMEYNTPRPFFHMFEAEDCVTAFNFADEKEANDLNKILKENMAARQRRRQERKRASQSTNAGNYFSSQHSVSTPQLSNGSTRPTHHRTAKGKDKQRQTEKKKISKADIGLPQDFRHVSHVGWNPNTGFDVSDEAEGSALNDFLKKAGVSAVQFNDRKTREFIYDFIKQNGGLDRVKDEVQSPDVPLQSSDVPLQSPDVPPPPVPARTVQSSASIRTAPPPPPPPSRNPLLPPPPQAAVMAPAPGPPPPPPLRTLPQRQDSTRGGPTPPPPPMQNAYGIPTPPSPPPMSASAPAPPAAPMAPAAPVAPAVLDTHSALIEAIRNGKTLKPVQPVEKKSRNGRDDLLDQIRNGIELKPVVPAARPAPTNSTPTLAEALQKALQTRFGVTQDSSDSSSAEDEDEDDWE